MTISSWLDIMPAIPLARGVPVVFHPGSGCKGVVVSLTDARHREGREGRVVVWDGISAAAWRSRVSLRVDLDDPQGFGYALRWVRRKDRRVYENHGLVWLAQNWMHGNVTDADRIALAKACAEVTR